MTRVQARALVAPARALALAVALATLPAPQAQAQDATGTVIVTVAPCPVESKLSGVPVTLSCQGLLTKAETDAKGQAVFLLVRPGQCKAIVPWGSGPLLVGIEVQVGAVVTLKVPVHEGPNGHEACDLPMSSVRTLPFASTTSHDRKTLDSTPRPSDPWSVLRDVPGIVVDRVNIGGSDTAQQSLLVSRGDPGTGATWTIDGAPVTDPAALGSSTVFPDRDALERIDVRIGALDVRVRSPGAEVGLRVREPEEHGSGALHLRGSSDALQWDNRPASLEGRPFLRNRTTRLVEAGAQAGGPLRAGRLWLFGAWSRNALRQDTFTEHSEDLRTTSFTGKGRLRLGNGSLSLLAIRSEKVHEDRDSGLAAAPGARWRQSGPTTLFSAADRRDVGSVSVSSRMSFLDAGFRLDPQGGTSSDPFEDYRGVLQRSYFSFATSRRRATAGIEAATRRSWLGRDHHLLFGLGYDRMPVATDLRWPGNQVLGLERDSVFFRAFRLTGFALPTRPQSARSVHDAAYLYLQDVVVRGRWALAGGLRLERIAGHNEPSSVPANPIFPDLLPPVRYEGGPTTFRWLDALPRLGISWDVTGRGHLLGRVSYAAYASPLGSGDVTFDNPIGREYASVTYYWNDRNGDRRVDRGELDLLRGRLGASGVLSGPSSSPASPNAIDAALRAPRTHELQGEMQLTFAAGWTGRASFSYRRIDNTLWRPLRNLTEADYAIRGAVQGTLLGRDYSVGYYAPASQSRIVPGNGRLLANRKGYHQEAFTTDASLAGKAGRHLQFEAWLSLSDWREYFDDRALSIQDPTPLESEPLLSGGMVTVRPGGLGRGDVVVNARWTAGGTLVGRLPLGLSVTARLFARDGFPIPYFQVGASGDPTGAAKNVIVAPQTDTYRLPVLLLLDTRLERPIPVGRGTLVAAMDAFNLLNRDSALQVARDVELPSIGRPREIVRPRILRIGVAYRF